MCIISNLSGADDYTVWLGTNIENLFNDDDDDGEEVFQGFMAKISFLPQKVQTNH